MGNCKEPMTSGEIFLFALLLGLLFGSIFGMMTFIFAVLIIEIINSVNIINTPIGMLAMLFYITVAIVICYKISYIEIVRNEKKKLQTRYLEGHKKWKKNTIYQVS